MRLAEIPCAGVRGDPSRPHSAQHRFSQVMGAAVARYDGSLRAPGSALTSFDGQRAANISRACGTLHPQRRCQPLPRRSGIGGPPQSAVPHDQIDLGPGDILAAGSGRDCLAGLRTCGEGRRSRRARQGRPPGQPRRWKLRQSDLAQYRVILSARCWVEYSRSRGPSGHGAPMSRI